MIVIHAESIYAATKEAFLILSNNKPVNLDDVDLLYEDSATIEILQPNKNRPFVIQNDAFRYTENYSEYFPDISDELIDIECKHYTELLLDSGRLQLAIRHLRESPASRRNVISTWVPENIDMQRPEAPCMSQLVFRLKNQQIELHAHFRANNAYSLLLLDMQMATSIQAIVAEKLGVEIGAYVHYVDSLHLYKRDEQHILKQQDNFLHAPRWRAV